MHTPDECLHILMQYPDVESAIALYKEVAGYIEAFEAVKRAARTVIEQALRERGEMDITTQAGKAAYTVPKTPKLNPALWRAALVAQPELRALQAQYDTAKDALELAQEPYKELPQPALRIV